VANQWKSELIMNVTVINYLSKNYNVMMDEKVIMRNVNELYDEESRERPRLLLRNRLQDK